MKDVKHIFVSAVASSEAMVVDRILIRVLPALIEYGKILTVENIREAQTIFVPEELYIHILKAAEELVGLKFVED